MKILPIVFRGFRSLYPGKIQRYNFQAFYSRTCLIIYFKTRREKLFIYRKTIMTTIQSAKTGDVPRIVTFNIRRARVHKRLRILLPVKVLPVVSLGDVNFEFCHHLGCSGQNAIIFIRKGLVQCCTRWNIKIYICLKMVFFRGQKSFGHAQVGLLYGFNSKFPTSIPAPQLHMRVFPTPLPPRAKESLGCRATSTSSEAVRSKLRLLYS